MIIKFIILHIAWCKLSAKYLTYMDGGMGVGGGRRVVGGGSVNDRIRYRPCMVT